MDTCAVEIHFLPFVAAVIILWAAVRTAVCIIKRKVDWRYELSQTAVLLVILIVARFTFFPTFREGGEVGPLIFDPDRMTDFLINIEPFYYIKKLWSNKLNFIINEVGNVLMFIPVGIVWPTVYKKLRAFWKTVLAGAAFSLIIEICQLPFYERTTDIDDIMLNTLGCAIGYCVFAIVRAINMGMNALDK